MICREQQQQHRPVSIWIHMLPCTSAVCSEGGRLRWPLTKTLPLHEVKAMWQN